MKRNEAEARIAELAKEIIEVVKEYSPDSKHFNLAYHEHEDKDGAGFFFNNNYWETQNRLDYYEQLDLTNK